MQDQSPDRPGSPDAEPLLRVEDLRVQFDTYQGTVYALDGVDLTVRAGQIVGLVGETGSGKTVTGRSILRLIEDPGQIMAGSITFNGRDLLALDEDEMRAVRGNHISMIFQEPMKSLNPAFTVSQQLVAVVTHHLDLSKAVAKERVRGLLDDLGLPDAGEVMDSYPHELSGGMAQRALIALGLACEPELIIADEPTTALDVTIQAQILRLFDRIQSEFGTSILLITHDLGVVDQVCERVNVMYAGEIVESGATEDVFSDPYHPYTKGLMGSLPERNLGNHSGIEGDVPDLRNPSEGCRFVDRCPVSKEACAEYNPPQTPVDGRSVRCVHYEDARPGNPEEVRDAF